VSLVGWAQPRENVVGLSAPYRIQGRDAVSRADLLLESTRAALNAIAGSMGGADAT
jgi:hypothetical protein